ncbi:SPFH domain-containing protein [Kitasatospora griseola]|uniref:SPFH domain-containing protein n=1 Tax=Kitasatospora griseola TaxID=2064 RepID=UPI0036DB14C6
MDVTRDSSPRPRSWPSAAEPPADPVGATQLSKAVAQAVNNPLIRPAAPAEEPLDRSAPTQQLPTVEAAALPAVGADEPSAFPPGPRTTSEPADPGGPRPFGAGRSDRAGSTAHPTVADAATHRRPPRADQSLRERPAFALPGWLPLLALLLGTAGVLLVLARAGVLPHLSGLPDVRTAAVKADGVQVDDRTIGAVSAIGLAMLLAIGGLLSNPGGETRVLTRWGRYRGTVRRTGLLWVNPLVRRRRVDVRLRHWRSEPVQVTDRTGTPLLVRVLIVWRVKDTARVTLGIADHETYLREQVQAVLTRTSSVLPCDSNSAPGPALRDGQWFADELTRALAAETAPAGIEVYSVQPLTLDYAPEVAESMRRRRLADLDAGLRTVLVDDAVEAAALAVRRLERATAHELDDSARSALMEQLLVAFVAPAGVTASVPAPAARPGRKEGKPA